MVKSRKYALFKDKSYHIILYRDILYTSGRARIIYILYISGKASSHKHTIDAQSVPPALKIVGYIFNDK